MWPKFPDICLTVEEKPRKTSTETDSTWNRIRARCVRATTLLQDHSGGHIWLLELKFQADFWKNVYIRIKDYARYAKNMTDMRDILMLLNKHLFSKPPDNIDHVELVIYIKHF